MQNRFTMLKGLYQIFIILWEGFSSTLAGKIVNQRSNLAAPGWRRRRAGNQLAAKQQ